MPQRDDEPTYEPQPLPTEHVELPQHLIDLGEVLARHVHDVWARRRIAEGWRYGPKRDDDKRLHPSLVPYGQLTDSERQYDRETALETLRALSMLGYRLKRE